MAAAHTGYKYTPIFFLSIAEYNVGEIDVSVQAGSWTGRSFLNYTAIVNSVGQEAAFNFSAPRLEESVEIWDAKACNETQFDYRNIHHRCVDFGMYVYVLCMYESV